MGVLGNLGGGCGEEPVRVGDLEAAARTDPAGGPVAEPAASAPEPADGIHKVFRQRQSSWDSAQ